MSNRLIEMLRNQFAIDQILQFEQHPNGLVQCLVRTSKCEAAFFLQGAHVASYRPGQQVHPVLFLSQKSNYEIGKPIRGGVPLCFPGSVRIH